MAITIYENGVVRLSGGENITGVHLVDENGATQPIGGTYNATAPTLSDGDASAFQVDANGNVKTIAGSVEVRSFFNAMAADVDISVKASSGNLLSIYVTNINAAVRFLQFHDKASAPANPDVPVLSLPIPAGSATVPGVLQLLDTFLGDGGYPFSVGIAIGISTTNTTFTAATTTDHYVAGSYV